MEIAEGYLLMPEVIIIIKIKYNGVPLFTNLEPDFLRNKPDKQSKISIYFLFI